MTSEAIHRFGSGSRERFGTSSPCWFPIQSGDSADFVAAVQALAVFPKVSGKEINAQGAARKNSRSFARRVN